jgi:hypothetical protein
MAALGIAQGVFLDIGSADGVNSNCANLALNFGWRGTFIDGDESNIAKGRAFHERHPDTWIYFPKFVQGMITRENINQLLTEASVPPGIDFMSIDLDGNDYWVWDAISVTSPKAVIIETHMLLSKIDGVEAKPVCSNDASVVRESNRFCQSGTASQASPSRAP